MAASPQCRLIDAYVPAISPEATEMQVLALGMPRTGSTSMHYALEMLGYKPFHMRQFARNPDTTRLWVEALKAKYHGEGKKFGTPELKKLLAGYNTIAGLPGNMFIEELLVAYPDAKVLITYRDEDSWISSVNSNIRTINGWNWGFISSYDPIWVGPLIEISIIVWNHWTRGDWNDKERLRQSYRDHYTLIRAKVPKEKLLEFNPKDGWDPLCKHLGKPVPQEPYPNVNDSASFVARQSALWWRTARKAAKTILLQALVPVSAVGAVGLWYWYN